MAAIECPACGEVNPADLEFCRNCQARLQQSETGNLRKAGGPIQPGQVPTKKATADLEPILPQWLRDARNEARDGAKAEAEQIAQNMQQPAMPAHKAPDLLAGLQSQGDNEDDDETPDWLATITGAAPKSKKAGTDEKDMRWVELGNEDNTPAPPGVSAATNRITATQAPSEAAPDSPLPAWLAGMDSGQQTGGDELSNLFSRSTPKPGEGLGADQAGLTEAGLGAGDALFQSQRKPSEPESSDWLKNLQADQSASAPVEAQDDTPFNTDLPDWMKSLEQSAPVNAEPAFASDTPDWLKGLDAGASAISDESAAPLASDDKSQLASDTSSSLAGRYKDAGLQSNSADQMKDAEQAQPAQTASADTPDWLKGFASETESAAPMPSADTVDWLKNAGQEKPAPVESEPAFSGDVPDWLKSAGQNDITPEAAASDLYGQSVIDETPAPAAPVFAQAETQNDSSPFFADQDLSGEDANSLFTQMPDWMSSTPADSKPAQDAPPAAQGADALSSAALPTWVQAMRPVESSFSKAIAQGIGTDQTPETSGPLAGLQGALPGLPFTPTSKPKAYSIKVQASREQQAHAALLEHILEAETKPEPLTSVPAVTSARGLRWVITILLLLITVGSLYAGTQIFAMPLGAPMELNSAIQAVENVPENAPVLVIFDYDPATVGEMEAVAAPLLDYMILKPDPDPRLTFVSTSPTGAALAERFISGPLGGHGYQSGTQYVNLGYLPGGIAGIRAFAQNPRTTMPMSIDSNPAWQSAPLQDVQSLSNFALIFLITDSAEAGRNWVEQAGALRGDAKFVVASSAQAGPMIMPYVQSGQVNGLVNGLNSGAVIEQRYASRQNSARRYWDAYSLGLFLAVTFIVFGGLWNLALGYRVRALAAKAGE
ncbi:MAG: hypothetical protein MUO77_21090 [Anaerolineales bacterium]|nr:hypothetical protein [Anaerolineales bacterium]